MSFEKIDTENIEPEKIPDTIDKSEKPSAVSNVFHQRANIIVNASEFDFVYLIFAFQKACEKHGIDYEDCLVLLYLYELGVFKLSVRVYSNNIRLKNYLLRGLIMEESLYNEKKLYKLSRISIDIIKMIVEFDNTRCKSKNRQSDLGVSLKVNSALSEYFQ